MGRVKQGRVHSSRARTRERAFGAHDFQPNYSRGAVGETPFSALRRQAQAILARNAKSNRR